jgi:hypothetical protein
MRPEGTSVFGLEQQPTVGTKINFENKKYEGPFPRTFAR